MSEIGLAATELGPDGFLPGDPDALAATLADHHLTAVGGFTPFVLHRADVDPLVELARLLPGFAAPGAGVMVLSADSGLAGYDSRPELDEAGWNRLLAQPRPSRGPRRRARHPGGAAPARRHHGGDRHRRAARARRVRRISLCLDTGHLLIGGTDPAELARQVPDGSRTPTSRTSTSPSPARSRTAASPTPKRSGTACTGRWAGRRRRRRHRGAPARNGYDGWYTLEQDTILTEPPRGEGPVADVRTSVDYLRGLLETDQARPRQPRSRPRARCTA